MKDELSLHAQIIERAAEDVRSFAGTLKEEGNKPFSSLKALRERGIELLKSLGRSQQKVQELARRYEWQNDETPEGEKIRKIATDIGGELAGLQAVADIATGELGDFSNTNLSAADVANDFGRTGDEILRLAHKLGRIRLKMAGDLDDAKKFANTAFNPQYEELVRQRDTQLANASARNAARGSIASSGMAREAAEIYGDTIHKILHARADALLEGVELYAVPIDQASDSIIKELEQMKADLVRTSRDSLERLPYLRTLGMGAYMGGELERAGTRALGEIRANMERKRLRKQEAAAGQNVTNVYHVYGHNPRWNTNSTDNSVNIVSISQEEIFAALKQDIVEKMQDGEERNDILQRLDALEKARGTKSFAERYTDFISAAANHMTIIAPFIPALSELLKKTLGG